MRSILVPLRTLESLSVFDHLDRLKAALADRYTVEREIGRGGMATVYFAQDSQTGHGVYGHSLQWLPVWSHKEKYP